MKQRLFTRAERFVVCGVAAVGVVGLGLIPSAHARVTEIQINNTTSQSPTLSAQATRCQASGPVNIK